LGNSPLNPSGSRLDGRGVGYMDVREALLPYRTATKTLLPIFDLEKNISYFKILISLTN
jgi:hypothetical protein